MHEKCVRYVRKCTCFGCRWICVGARMSSRWPSPVLDVSRTDNYPISYGFLVERNVPNSLCDIMYARMYLCIAESSMHVYIYIFVFD